MCFSTIEIISHYLKVIKNNYSFNILVILIYFMIDVGRYEYILIPEVKLFTRLMYARWIQSIFLYNRIQFFVSIYNSITTTDNDLI